MKSFLYSVWETFEVVAVAVIAVFLIRTFLIQPFLVNGASMEPNFSSGDYLLIDEISYRFREPARGEVVVFRYPGDPGTYFIKRVIGLPGEKVSISGGRIEISDSAGSSKFVLDENYLPTGLKTSGDEKLELKADEYFVLGDNRNYSFDSRSWGVLDNSKIVGLVRLRLWPFNKVLAIEKPAY